MKKLQRRQKLAPDDLAKLSDDKAELELIGDYEDMDKIRHVLRELSEMTP
jgi:hypothetical protein